MTDKTVAIDALPLDALETRLSTVIPATASDRFDILKGGVVPELLIINGSFGGQVATETSDVDVTVGVLETPAVEGVHTDQWIDLSQCLSTRMDPVNGHPLEVQVFPTPEAVDHVKRRSAHGGYETVYNLGSREFVDVGALR